jgi:hypothetical protein
MLAECELLTSAPWLPAHTVRFIRTGTRGAHPCTHRYTNLNYEAPVSCVSTITASPVDQTFAPDNVVEFLFLAIGTDSVPVDGV